MTGTVLPSLLAVVAALLVAFALVVAVEGFSAIVHPFPADFDGSYAQMLEHVARYPAWVLAVASLMWAGIVLLCTWMATRFGSARHRAHGVVVGAILLAAVVFNMAMLPYPLWFEVANVILFPLATYCGVSLARGPRGEGVQPLR